MGKLEQTDIEWIDDGKMPSADEAAKIVIPDEIRKKWDDSLDNLIKDLGL